ncbi:MAG: AAA domain-containing protein [Desulfobacterales bacterium]|nr:AAA domain-containing protein [Desulfobacterales bacterium]MCP4160103.1 AAA domain-containing protein [Deltaproteobacteria bacterium]
MFKRKNYEAMGESDTFLDFQEKLSSVAPVERSVLLIGERGTGKELAAQRVHYLSKRWKKPYITLNCASLSSSLIESELFGHEKGAFTGASQSKKGRFESANGGTLFLDEIGNIPLVTQEKILRVVEYGKYERVGSSEEIDCDVRIVAATNIDLSKAADNGTFMRDLLDRLSFEVIFLPPLRERKSDILLLANFFASAMAHELNFVEIPSLSKEVEESLISHEWSGNVRELKNTIERAVYKSENGTINNITFNPFVNPYEKVEEVTNEFIEIEDKKIADKGFQYPKGVSFNQAVDDFKLNLLKETLKRTNYNQKRAAKELNITYNKFRGIYRKYQDRINQGAI